MFHSGSGNCQKTREIKQITITKYFFDQNPFFAISKMAKNKFLAWEKIYNFIYLFI